MSGQAGGFPGDGLGLGSGAHRPVTLGSRHMVAAGHHAAAQAGLAILEAGGNAVDAGVAAGMALGVLQPDLVNVAGVAPTMIRMAETGEVVTISGLGCYPKQASAAYFRQHHGGDIPSGLLRTVVPAAPDAWITALAKFGTMRFADVAAASIRYAAEGFPTHALLADFIATNEDKFARWDANKAIYLPKGRPPRLGELFVQDDLARTLTYMADQEKSAGGSREDGLKAARDAFYKGDIARSIARYHAENGGWMTEQDLADFSVAIEAPEKGRFGNMEVYTCAVWCQGPVLIQMLKLLAGTDLRALGHNSPAYIHLLTEAMKLSFADREAYYGDPRFVDVPMAELLSDAYADLRRGLIDPAKAWPEMPPAGDPRNMRAILGNSGSAAPVRQDEPAMSPDTSYVSVVDRWGNVFSATPSDTSNDTPVIPGLGICPSSRGSQGFTQEGHASEVMGGKRPRLTPNPALAVFDNGTLMPFGTPGGDVQSQAMLQVLLNVAVFGLDTQSAIDAPRFATYSFPDSFAPHPYYPGRLSIEGRIEGKTAEALSALGHEVVRWPDWTWKAGGVCAIVADPKTGLKAGGADRRRPSGVVGL
ncbi:MAG: gamma-glutamyltransferase family protein [Alphaproteobacteria bacterium]|nr:gamma-glutamyltransferase family protein [Alphaproteobacteria bacterium]MBU0798561.1 gamma-glutamyltransferase family protein [Alphaproteobacteria bacterium]MBU0889208.1 gamma-glutamyltransferase family protein [Alphaproteobacteria bacterium]MBU1813797.1 gamma-glutamyltransferase family protein [Alphaproteobacteria bacterium]MBU2090972.1 gamma-glutamyltransferase family protein [Alphaproteobacteria bacterium]